MKRRHLFFSISFRLLVFNLLILVFPIASFLFLNTYEQQLLKYLEHALVQQGRVMAAALGGTEAIEKETAVNLLLRMEKKHEARFRILDSTGAVITDSSLLPLPDIEASTIVDADAADSSDYRNDYRRGSSPTDEYTEGESDPRERFLYRLASLPVRLLRNYLLPPTPPIESGDFYKGALQLLGPEVMTALQGSYGAATRISTGGQISVTLYSALPVRNPNDVIGVVLVSQSSYRILQDLYSLRLDIFKIFLLSLLATIVISIFLSITISRPLKKLSLKAQKIFSPGGKFQGRFITRKGRDEIGKLAAGLDKLTEQLREHISFIESFASDVSHELKNPIASIRSSAEIAAGLIEDSTGEKHIPARSKADAEKFLGIIQREAARMESLITSIRDISKIDTRLEEEEKEQVDLLRLTRQVIEGCKLRLEGKTIHFNLQIPKESVQISAAPERIIQVLENLIDNAAGFSPDNGSISVTIESRQRPGIILLSISDEGPGIPGDIKDKIFTRFFSYRKQPEWDKNQPGSPIDHTGLGLAIVKAIVEGYGGTITAENIPESGARFTVTLPQLQK